ncbi:MAG: hypothetical protein I3273_01150 [Candidatus Moeniiplasma glomeromycotorum]|nr:hypothetical protein [Candidatus Moeniiplasma glomeromycotorum]MCE8167271.1 hypothetical protein [Candidatus Moeniiplasma glomeromycotorum]MCE8168716.1 hypothetical protein [Candidatus Moeniiplasma glomeromycotorum]
MPLKLIDYRVVKGEKRWTYPLKITFNGRKIVETTITGYYQTKLGRKMITNELIIKLLEKLNSRRLRPTKYPHRKVFKWETSYQGQFYRLFFWFKKGTTKHLWIRNCYPIN